MRMCVATVECGMQNTECGVQAGPGGVVRTVVSQSTDCEIRHAECKAGPVRAGVGRAENAESKMQNTPCITRRGITARTTAHLLKKGEELEELEETENKHRSSRCLQVQNTE